MMKTIEAFELEIGYQRDEIPRLARELGRIIRKLGDEEQERSLITGAGDSLAAAMVAECASGNKVRAVDPLDICANPSIAKDRILYVASISGSTRTNIEAVDAAARQGAAKRVAITARKESVLAKRCDEVMELRYKNAGIPTAGSIGFTASMVACLSLVRDLEIDDLTKLFASAKSEAGRVTLGNEAYLLGRWFTYPLAMYGCAKMFEVLGMKARYAALEQFAHMEVFSLRKNDSVLILSADGKAGKLSSKLKDYGCSVFVFGPEGRNLEEQVVYYTLLLQLIALNNARRLELDECYFVTSERLREISSSMIY